MTPTPHPSIFPILLRLWNESPVAFYRYLARFGIPNDAADAYLSLTQAWIEATGHGEYLNG